MGELLHQLIKKAKLEAQESLRQLIGALNGLAGIYRIQEKVGITPSYVNECSICNTVECVNIMLSLLSIMLNLA